MKKKTSKHQESEDHDMLPEYAFKDGIRGKHYKAYRKGHTVKIHKTDGTAIVQYFKLEDGAVMLEPVPGLSPFPIRQFKKDAV